MILAAESKLLIPRLPRLVIPPLAFPAPRRDIVRPARPASRISPRLTRGPRTTPTSGVHLMRRNVDGKRALVRSSNNTGGVGSGPGSGPCCCHTCGECKFGTVPTTWTLSTSGITLATCPGCLTYNVFQGFEISTPLSGSCLSTCTLEPLQDLFITVSTCVWTSVPVDSMSVIFYSTPGCSPFSANGSESGDFNWTLERDGSEWTLFGAAATGPPPITYYAFLATLPASPNDDCSAGALTFTNTLTTPCVFIDPADPTSFVVGTLGTVVVTPHP